MVADKRSFYQSRLANRTCSIELQHCRWHWVPNHHKTTAISIFCIAFHIFVAGYRRDFKLVCGLNIASPSTDDKPSVKWAWSRHMIQFKFQVPQSYLRNNWS